VRHQALKVEKKSYHSLLARQALRKAIDQTLWEVPPNPKSRGTDFQGSRFNDRLDRQLTLNRSGHETHKTGLPKNCICFVNAVSLVGIVVVSAGMFMATRIVLRK
jgi:hypothetical protein